MVSVVEFGFGNMLSNINCRVLDADGVVRFGVGKRSVGLVGKVFSLLFVFVLFVGLFGAVSVFAADSDLSVNLSVSHLRYQTWDDLTTLTSPPAQIVTFGVSISEEYVSGGVVELPLDFVPTAVSHPTFTYGTDGTNGVGSAGGSPGFFVFNAAEFDIWLSGVLNTAVENYEIVGAGESAVLRLILKDVAGGVSSGLCSVPLRFDFNTAWTSKIPGETALWTVAPKVKLGTEYLDAPAPQSIISCANNVLSVGGISRFSPIDRYYPGGAITFRQVMSLDYYYMTNLDPTYDNTVWAEIPTGSAPNTILTNYPSLPTGPIVGDGTNGVDDGYTRYYRVLEPAPTDTNHGDWSSWHYAGYAYRVFRQMDHTFTPPSMANGETFEVRFGADYRQVNGVQKVASTLAVYERADRQAWNIRLANTHSTGDATTNLPIVSLASGSVSTSNLNAISYTAYTHSGTLKNTGTVPITGVSFTLYQKESTSSPAKVNFNTVTLYALRDPADAPSYPAWSHYKVDYEIYDTDDGSIRSVPNYFSGGDTVWVSTGAGSSGTVTLSLPSLGNTEYINKIIVTPMGTDGLPASEGEWPSQNGLCLVYGAKAWDGPMWPDGTPMDAYTRVAMGWTLTYDNCPSGDRDTGYPSDYYTNPAYDSFRGTNQEGNTGYFYYTDAPYALATMTSSNAGGCLPEAVVDYTIIGYNHGGFTTSDGLWRNPRIMARVPKILEIASGSSTLVGVDLASGTTFDVTPKLEHSDATYNYYSFQAEGYNAPRGSRYTPVFTIAVQFNIANNARPGTYPIRLLVSDGDPENFYQSATLGVSINGNLGTGDDKSNYGLSGAYDNYYLMPTSNSPVPVSTSLVVISQANIGVRSSVKDPVSDLWVDSTVVPVAHGMPVEVKLTITNRGSAPLTNVRLYDILPYNGDGVGIPGYGDSSNGAISFVSVTPSSGGTVRYATATVGSSTVPRYGQHGNADPNLQTFSYTGWLTSDPGSGVTAVFIDYGATVIGPGDSLEVIMKFDVPISGEQTAFNQFRYSAVEQDDTSVMINLNSPVAGFSTEAIAIVYDANLPAVVATPTGLSGMPSDVSAIWGGDPAVDHFSSGAKDSLMVSDVEPSLTGYTFAGWYNIDSSGNPFDYDPGYWKQFSAGELFMLYANWTRNVIDVVYREVDESLVDGFTAAAGSDTALFGGLVGSTTGSPLGYVDPGMPHNDTHNFVGWYATAAAAEAHIASLRWEFDSDHVWSPSIDTKTFYAGWTPKSVEVTYMNGTEVFTVDTSKKYGEKLVAPVSDPVLVGHTFGGWYMDTSFVDEWDFAAYELTDVNGVLYDAGSGEWSLTLYAKWSVNSHSVAYEYDGGVPTGAPSVPATASYDFGDVVTVVAAPTFAGYTFSGWAVKSGGVTISSAGDFSMPDADVVLSGTWTADPVEGEFIVTYLGNGSTGGVPPVDYYLYFAGDIVVVMGQGSLTRNGSVFLGWSQDSVATSAQYTAGSKFTMPDNDVVLYAVWSQDVYTITFGPGAHGTFNAQVISGLHYGDVTPAAPTVTGETGWVFTGWSPVPSATVTGDATYVAQWTQTSTPTPTASPTPTPTPTASPTPTPTTSPTPTPTSTASPIDRQREDPVTESKWAVVNLVLAVVGVVLAVVVFVRALLLKKRKDDDDARGRKSVAKSAGGGAGFDGKTGDGGAASENFVQRRVVWLIAVLVLAVVGVVVFVLTEDWSLSMGWVDRWTVVNAVIFVVEIFCMLFVFKLQQVKTTNETPNSSTTPTQKTA